MREGGLPGEPETARGYYNQALGRIAAGEGADALEHGGLLLAQSGEPDRALDLFEQTHRLAANPKDAAAVLSDIARMRARKGDLDQALQLLKETLRDFKALREEARGQ